MKKLALSSLMIMSTCFAFSQVFHIKSIGSQYSQEQIINAFNQADFCGCFFSSERNLISLMDGSVVELLTREELENEGVILPDRCFLPDNTTLLEASWSITQEGHLMKVMNTYTSEKEYLHFNTEQ